MQTSQDSSINPLHVTPGAPASAGASPAAVAASGDYRIIRRNGAVVAFEPSKIAVAVTKAFLAVNGGQGAASARVRELVEQLTDNVVTALVRRQPSGGNARTSSTVARIARASSAASSALRERDVVVLSLLKETTTCLP